MLEKAGVEIGDPDTAQEGEPDGTAAVDGLPVHDAVRGARRPKAGKDLNYGTFRAAAENLERSRSPAHRTRTRSAARPTPTAIRPSTSTEWDTAAKDFELDEG